MNSIDILTNLIAKAMNAYTTLTVFYISTTELYGFK